MTHYHIFQPFSPFFNRIIPDDFLAPEQNRANALLAQYEVFRRDTAQIRQKIHLLTERLLQQNPSCFDITASLNALYNIKIPLHLIETIIKIILFTKKITLFGTWTRFKIKGICSVSLFNRADLDVFVIHLKKKEHQTHLARGFNSKIDQAIYFNGHSFTMMADKTTYQFPIGYTFKKDLPLDRPELFIDDPESFNFYSSYTKNEGGLTPKIKASLIYKLYETSLCEIIDLNNTHHFLSDLKKIQIALSLAICIKALHDKGILHRDIKLDNFLIKLDTSKESLDLSDFKIVAADFETFAYESAESPFWVGTTMYQPPNKLHTRQTKASDIYALGVTFKLLSSETAEKVKELEALISSMTLLDASRRPLIDEVIAHLSTILRSLS